MLVLSFLYLLTLGPFSFYTSPFITLYLLSSLSLILSHLPTLLLRLLLFSFLTLSFYISLSSSPSSLSFPILPSPSISFSPFFSSLAHYFSISPSFSLSSLSIPLSPVIFPHTFNSVVPSLKMFSTFFTILYSLSV